MTYQERLATRKRLFGRMFQAITEKGHETTFPAPFDWNYIRGYHPRFGEGMVDNTLLPHEQRNKNLHKFTRRFEY